MRRDKARIAVYALAGVYLLYLVWKIWEGLPTAGSEKPLMLIFGVLFALIGVVAVGFGVYSGWKQAKETAEALKQSSDPGQEEETTDSKEQ